jgi:hypothetical protein
VSGLMVARRGEGSGNPREGTLTRGIGNNHELMAGEGTLGRMGIGMMAIGRTVSRTG